MSDKRISQLVERVSIANNDVLPIVALNAATTNKVTISTIQDWMQTHLDHGVTSVGITIGSTGTDISVTGSPVTSTGNITINVPTSSAANRGLLSAADWTTFNNKVGTARSINTTAPLQGGGDLSADRTLSITQAGASSNGYLSSTDWNTFNNKQDALGYTPVNQTRQLTINGTSYDLSADRTWNVGTVTSIGVSMPSAFTVSNSPITSSGTIAITGAGSTSQYIDGTGALQTFPTIIGEASNLVREVYNESGATMTKGTVVYINGGHGNLPTIAKALATGDSTSAQTYGVVQNNIGNNSNGFIVVIGDLIDMVTDAYTEGTQLYLSGTTAGAFTSTKPYAPIHLVYVGIVTRSHPTQGVIAIKIQNGYEMDELHNVDAHLPTDGDILKYVSSTGLWTKTEGSTTNITEGTRLYYTDARARGAFSETVTGLDYNSSTGVLSTSAGYGIPSNSDQALWTAAYEDTIISAAVTGTTTKTLTLTQRDSTTITASWTDINTDAVTSVFGRTGAVVAVSGDYDTDKVTEGTTNLYFTNARSRSSISLTTTGTSGAATYDSATGVLNIPSYVGGVTSVFGRTGAVVAASGDYTTTQVTEGTNLYYTDGRARGAISLTTTGTSGAATYNNATGAFNIPNYSLSGLGGVPSTRKLTINGVEQDLSADRSWTIYNIGTTGLGNATVNVNYGGTYVLRNENGLGAVLSYAPVLHVAAGDTMWQLQGTYGSSGNGDIYFRQGYNGSWGTWLQLLSEGNFTAYAVPKTRTLTINGTAYDLTADRSWTITAGVTGSGVTNRIAYWDSASSIGYLDTASYPSLTELGYVKGVTSAIQTQLNSKQNALSSPLAYGGNYSTPGYTGATYDGITTGGYYRITGTGDSRGVLVFDVGGSVGTTQIETSYNEGLRFRNKTDNASWTAFKRILDVSNYSGLLAGGSISGGFGFGGTTTITQGDIKLYTYQNTAGSYKFIGTEYAPGNGNNKAEIRFGIDGSDTRTKISFHVANGGGTLNEALSIGYTNTATFNGDVYANNVSALAFFNNQGYPYNTQFGSGADASFSKLQAGSTAGYQSSVTVYGGGSPSGANQIIMQTASATRAVINNDSFVVYNNTYLPTLQRNDGETGSKNWNITRGFNTGSVDEYWIRIYMQQYYSAYYVNDGRVELDIVWNPIHASFAAYTKLEFNYHSTYWRSPSYCYFSPVKKTRVGDFGGGTYYGPSSTPQVDLYDKNDGWLYVRVKGNTTTNNLNQLKTLRMQMLGYLDQNPTIEFGVAAPTGGSFLTYSYTFEQADGNLYVSGDVTAYSSSDKRLKDNVNKIDNPIDKIMKLNGVTFDWNDKQLAYESGTKDYGVIAQEVEEVMPELVKDRDNGYKGVRYEKMIPLLIECIKEQQLQINNLKNQN